MITSKLARSSTAVLGLSALAVAFAANGYHYSQIEGYKYNKTPIDTYPVRIVSIDGKSNPERRIQVDPGLRHIVVQAPPSGGMSGAEQSFDLDVAPCTRYYLVAQKRNRLQQEFTPKVDYQEPVEGCTPPH